MFKHDGLQGNGQSTRFTLSLLKYQSPTVSAMVCETRESQCQYYNAFQGKKHVQHSNLNAQEGEGSNNRSLTLM